MIKIIIEIEEKETLKYKQLEAKNVVCDIKKIYRKPTRGEYESAEEIIKRATNNHETVGIIDKIKNKDEDIDKLIKLLSRI